jgi:hypothetical protein
MQLPARVRRLLETARSRVDPPPSFAWIGMLTENEVTVADTTGPRVRPLGTERQLSHAATDTRSGPRSGAYRRRE